MLWYFPAEELLHLRSADTAIFDFSISISIGLSELLDTTTLLLSSHNDKHDNDILKNTLHTFTTSTWEARKDWASI